MSTAPAVSARQDFIDWLKASGMVLILIGHVVGGPDALFNVVSVPVYSKQLGVAFFVFATGWGLANDRRARLRAAFNRAFPVYFFGLLCALALSAIYWFSKGTINKSNYLPLLGGVNVLFNFFPANPTTWYIGTYLHLLAFWLWLGPRRVTPLHLVLALVLEVCVRAFFLGLERPFTGYMLLTNWLTVFLLGQYLRDLSDRPGAVRAAIVGALWLAALALWPRLFAALEFNGSFPTRLPAVAPSLAPWLASVMVSVVYLGNTLLALWLFRAVPCNGLVRFVARNSLLIFILHMPIIYALSPAVYGLADEFWAQRALMVALLLLTIGLFSEVVHRAIDVTAWRDRCWQVATARTNPKPLE
ncbi:MAG: acyltransferase family protein [Pseudohaliea sp.]